MRKVNVITDSLACLTRELVSQYNIGVIPLNFYVDGKLYRDWVDITPAEAYELFIKDPETFRSSAALPGDILKIYRESGQQARDILCITASSKLSTNYNVALNVAETYRQENRHSNIQVMDSENATPSQGFVALVAARAAAEGQDLSAVMEAADKVREKVGCFFLLDTLRYVYRSGRIPKIAAQAASKLNIRPILSIDSGVVKFSGAVRNRSHGIERVISIIKDRVQDNSVHFAVVHAYALEEAEKLKERVMTEFNCTEIWLSEMSPLMGYACGTGTLGLAFYTD